MVGRCELITFGEEGIGMGGVDRDLAQDPDQITVAVVGGVEYPAEMTR